MDATEQDLLCSADVCTSLKNNFTAMFQLLFGGHVPGYAIGVCLHEMQWCKANIARCNIKSKNLLIILSSLCIFLGC